MNKKVKVTARRPLWGHFQPYTSLRLLLIRLFTCSVKSNQMSICSETDTADRLKVVKEIEMFSPENQQQLLVLLSCKCSTKKQQKKRLYLAK